MLQLEFKQENISSLDLNQQTRISIGRDKSNDVILENPNVSGVHAEIRIEGSGCFVLDLGSTNGTFVNGSKVQGRQEIKAWDKINFAQIEAEVVDTERSRPTQLSQAVQTGEPGNSGKESTPQWTLEGFSGKFKGKSYPIKGKMTVGREQSCDICIDSKMISKKHAEISPGDGVLELKDLGSTNGTFVNGTRVQATFLKSGDRLSFDQEMFWVKGKDRDEDKTQVREALSADATRTRSAVGSNKETKAAVSGAPSASGQSRLVVQKGKAGKKSFYLTKQSMVLGRSSECDICIAEDTVSSRHANLGYTANGWEIEDLGSSNGIYINGKKISSKILVPGDKITVGRIELHFEDTPKGAQSTTRHVSSLQNEASGSSTQMNTGPIITGPREKDAQEKKASSGRNKLPGWAYALIGFGAVLLALGIILYLRNFYFVGSNMVEAKLQGSKIWSQQLPGKREAPSTPALADINNDDFLDVIIPDSSGFVLALDGEKGKMIFQAEVSNRIMAPVNFGDLSGDGGSDVLVCSNTGIVSALNGQGQFLWQSSEELGLGSIINSPLLSNLNKDSIQDVIVPTSEKGLVALDGSRGWEIWNTAEMCRGEMITSPVKADLNADGVNDFVGVTKAGEVLAVTSEGEKVWQLWKTDLEKIYYASPLYIPADSGGLMVVATDKSGILALKAKNGRRAWISDISQRFFASPIGVDANGDDFQDVVAVSQNGNIYVLNGKNGDLIWKQSPGVEVQATPAVYDVNDDGLKDLVLPDTAGNIRVIDMQRGRTILELDVPGSDGFVASPVMGDVNNDGLMDIVVASQNGRIAAYGINRRAKKGHAFWPRFLGNYQHAME